MFEGYRELTGDELLSKLTLNLTIMKPSPQIGPGKRFAGSDDARRIAAALIAQLKLSGVKIIQPPPKKSHGGDFPGHESARKV